MPIYFSIVEGIVPDQQTLWFVKPSFRKDQFSCWPKIAIASSFDEILKKPRVSLLLSLDPSKEKMQPFHHPKDFGDSWPSTEKQLVAILSTDSSAIPIEVILKLVKDFKLKSHSIEDFSLVIDNVKSLAALINPKINFHYKNLVHLVPSPTRI